MARTLEEVRLQAELVTQLAKRARRDATMMVQAAAQLESMVAETVDLGEDNDVGRDTQQDERGA